MSTAFDQLQQALAALARRDVAPPCAGDDRFISEDRDERRCAAVVCLGCPVYDACRAVGQARGTQRPHHGVWGGLDVSRDPDEVAPAVEGLTGLEAHLVAEVVAVVGRSPGAITGDVKAAVHERGFTGRDGMISTALRHAAEAGLLERRQGARHSYHWHPASPDLLTSDNGE